MKSSEYRKHDWRKKHLEHNPKIRSCVVQMALPLLYVGVPYNAARWLKRNHAAPETKE